LSCDGPSSAPLADRMRGRIRDSLMDLPCFCGSELVQDRGSCPDRTLSKFLRSGRFRSPHSRLWKPPSYLRKRFLDIAVDGVPHLGNHIGWLGGNLSCLNTTGHFRRQLRARPTPESEYIAVTGPYPFHLSLLT
jgi:hypothetical protein